MVAEADIDSLPVTVVATASLAELLDPVPGRRMAMPGFAEEFVDFPDYIIRITDRIWHQRRVELCRDYYSPHCVIHTLGGDIIGAETVAQNTYATMEAFPDRRLEADNVIWSAESDGESFYSSHLITSQMTNAGASAFGPATGRAVQVLTIADCLCRENRIVEEWLMRDNAGLALQLGFDPAAIARREAEAEADLESKAEPGLAALHAAAHSAVMAAPLANAAFPRQAEAEPEAFARAVFGRLWNQRDYGAAERIYDFRVDAALPRARRLYGPAQMAAALSGLLASFPDARLRIEHIAHVPYLGDARDIAVRWTLAGTHMGEGDYGPPSGAPVLIIGASQWRVINGQIHREWTVWDDIAVLRQIAEARLAA